MLATTGCRDQARKAVPSQENPLEAAAQEANLVVDPLTTPPTGLFERRHAAGLDAICMVPDEDDAYRFGMVVSFGTNLTCQGGGTAVQDGENLTLSFRDAECTVKASYDGQSIHIEGRVAEGCSALCGPRASMSGVGVQRVGWNEADARLLEARVVQGRPTPRMCQ